MKNTHKIYAMVIAITSLFSNCQKAKDGAPGKDGSANVSSIVYTITSWSSNSSKYYTVLSVPSITADNINTASVQAYFSTIDNSWLAMPFTKVASTDYYMGYTSSVGVVQINWDYNGLGIGDDPNTFYGVSSCKFKVVVIPPAILKQYPTVNMNNYSEVKEAFQLKD